MDLFWSFMWSLVTIVVLGIIYFAIWEDSDKRDDWRE